MPPIALNRRRFLGCSAAASLALSQGTLAEADLTAAEATPVRLGLIGIGNRGTALLRALLDLPAARVVGVCDPEPKHRLRGQGIVEKVQGWRPEAVEDPRRLLERPDVDAVIAAVPCDLHESIGCETLRAGKHLYAEKPLALTLAGCDRLCIEASRRPALVVHVGFQRRSNPRFREGVERIQRRELGPLIEARATWTSSNGPLSGHGGWLGRRDRSGDFMVEQAVHIWDVLHWLHGDLPVKAAGWGRRGLFAQQDPGRDVTDHYAVELEWADGFRASLLQSWVAPAADGFTGSTLRVLGEAGGLDFGAGSLTFRDRQKPRQAIHPGPQNDTRLALLDFLTSVRAEKPLPPPITLAEARSATLTGLLVRKAVDERRTVTMDEIRSESSNA
ncbi:MAG: Gfo/Idh/MocA family oxidoreductase [Planctomycetaceae bacterium]|nr:Gfo/Idh/MocA family oxidoreductase [Planctomycetaceae bacterium]MBV8309627.1 Gfo/Idh/MocA family oxidoreductase [Planctomycetaceae bacterium]